jgi:hypothetical protein
MHLETATLIEDDAVPASEVKRLARIDAASVDADRAPVVVDLDGEDAELRRFE